MRACGGISNERSSSNPCRPLEVSGLNILSMHSSERWVLPVTSTSRLRKMRSTIHGGTGPAGLASICRNAISSSSTLSCRASSRRGAWLVGPTNIPEKKYDSAG